MGWDFQIQWKISYKNKTNTHINVLICENHNSDGVEWLVSFTTNNPTKEECVVVKDYENAARLIDLVDKHFMNTDPSPV